MARPIAGKFVMRTPEEKERIVLEAIERGARRTAEARGVDRRLLQRWIAKYRAAGVGGLKSQTGKHGGGKHGGGNPLAGLRNKKNKTREEELELEVLKLKVEVERLKKRVPSERGWSRKGIRYYQRLEYEILEGLSGRYPVSLLCREMSVNRSGYYKWKWRRSHPSERHVQRMGDVEYIKEQSARHKAHGYRWLAAYLKRKYGASYSPGYVYRCRKYAGILCESKHYRWNKPGSEALAFENLIGNRWGASKPAEILVSDMTAFYAKGTYYELTLYFDTFNREIVGFGLTDRRGDVRPYFDGLAQAIEAMKGKEQSDPTILHTDRGAVYSSRAFNELLSNHAVVHSVSRAGTPTDNPIDESLNGWIKDELFIDFNLRKCDDVLSLIKAYVDYYNNERPMCCLGYKTPRQYRTDMGY